MGISGKDGGLLKCEKKLSKGQDIIKTWEKSRNSFAEYSLSEEESKYLDDFSFIYQLCYDIYMRKQIIEKLIDRRREEHPKKKKG